MVAIRFARHAALAIATLFDGGDPLRPTRRARARHVQRLLPVTGNWGSVLTALIPLALVIAVSPLTIIPAVLVLHAPRPRPTGLAFLGGWLLGLCALTAIFVSASGLLSGLHKAPPAWASWVRVALGSALILFGIYRWLTRHRESDTPRWMRAFDTITPARAGGAAVVLTVARPEVSLMCIAAGLNIGTGGFDIGGKLVAAAVFIVISASTVAVPILAYVGAGDRLDEPLNPAQGLDGEEPCGNARRRLRPHRSDGGLQRSQRVVIPPPAARPGAVTAAVRGTAQRDPLRYFRPGLATATSVTPRANAPTTISGCHHCAPSQ